MLDISSNNSDEVLSILRDYYDNKTKENTSVDWDKLLF